MSTSPFNGGSSSRAKDRVERSSQADKTPATSTPDKQSDSPSSSGKIDISKTDVSKVDWENLDPKTVDWSKATPEHKARWRQQQSDNMRVYNEHMDAQRRTRDQADLKQAREFEKSKKLDRAKPDLTKRSSLTRNANEVDRLSKRVF